MIQHKSICGAAAFLAALGITSPMSLSGQSFAQAIDLYGGVDGSVEYTTNAFLNDEELEDTIFSVTPFVGIARDQGLFSMDGSAGISVKRYVDYTDNDSEGLFANLSGSYAGEPLGGTAYVNYSQDNQASGAVGTILETYDLTVGGSADYYITSIWGLNGAASYQSSQSETAGFGDTATWSVSGGGFYDYSSALSFNLDVRYRKTEVTEVSETSNDSEDIALIGGATGQLLPTVVGQAEVGIQQRSFDAPELDDEIRPYLFLSATWEINSLTNFTLAGGYDYSTTVSNLSQDSFTLSGTLNHNFTNQLSGNVGVGFEDSTFENTIPGVEERKDTEWSLFGGVNYRLTDWGSVSLQLDYGDRDSNEDFYTYKVFTATLSASATF